MVKSSGRQPSAVVTERLARLRRRMKRQWYSAFLVTRPVDYFYLIGFTGEDSAVVVTGGGVHVITDRRFEASFTGECGWAQRWLREGTLSEEIGRVCQHLRVRTLAVQSDHLTMRDHARIRTRTGRCKLVAATPILAELRCIKDPYDLARMRKALRVAEAAFEATRASIRIGQTELQIAARLEYEMKCRGASGPAFPTICAEGANAAHPHAHPGMRKVKRGGAILLDWGARVGGYCSDLTRMVFIGSLPRRIGSLYRIALTAQQRAIAAVRPGATMRDVDAVARHCVADAGYGDAFKHGLGHGLGLEVHEAPSLSWRSTETLVAGMVVTVEPGIYLPGVGGVRIEDEVLVTSTGHRVLSRLAREPDEAILRVRR